MFANDGFLFLLNVNKCTIGIVVEIICYDFYILLCVNQIYLKYCKTISNNLY